MHAFMTPGLLWVSRLDQLGRDAETDPPDREQRQAAERGGREGHAVVGADDPREAEFLEEAHEDRPGIQVSGGVEPLAAQEKTADAIHNGERITIEPVSSAELALEVSRPDLVRFGHGSVGAPWVSRTGAASAFGDQAGPREDVAASASRRPFPIGVVWGENLEELFHSPAGVSLAGLDQSRHDARGSLIRTGAGTAGALATDHQQESAWSLMRADAPLLRDEFPELASELEFLLHRGGQTGRNCR